MTATIAEQVATAAEYLNLNHREWWRDVDLDAFDHDNPYANEWRRVILAHRASLGSAS